MGIWGSNDNPTIFNMKGSKITSHDWAAFKVAELIFTHQLKQETFPQISEQHLGVKTRVKELKEAILIGL